MASREQILRDVKIVLDENEQNEFGYLDISGSIEDPDQLQTDTIIDRLIDAAIDKVHRMASLDYISDISGGSIGDVEWVDFDDYCSRAVVPDDFVRLIYVRLAGWKRGATSFLNESDPLYAEYFSKFAGVRPTSINPSAAIVNGDEDGKLDIVACPRNGEGSSIFRYIKQSDGSESGEYTIASKCYWAVIYMIANLYYVTIGENERAAMMAAECVEQLGMQANAAPEV